jgi:hypothetical protein
MRVKHYHQRWFQNGTFEQVKAWFERHQDFVLINVQMFRSESPSYQYRDGYMAYFYTESELKIE